MDIIWENELKKGGHFALDCGFPSNRAVLYNKKEEEIDELDLDQLVELWIEEQAENFKKKLKGVD